MAEDEYDGINIVHATAKTLRRLLKGTAAEAAVPALLTARDSCLAVEAAVAAVADAEAEEADAAAAAVAAESAASPGFQICFEAYGSVRPPLTSEVHRYHACKVHVAVFESRDPPAAGTLWL
jgi:hypothetical protein